MRNVKCIHLNVLHWKLEDSCFAREAETASEHNYQRVLLSVSVVGKVTARPRETEPRPQPRRRIWQWGLEKTPTTQGLGWWLLSNLAQGAAPGPGVC